MSVYKAWMPYVLVSILLIATRLPSLGIGPFLQSLKLGWPSVLGTSISASSLQLYLPGTMLIIAALVAVLALKMPSSGFKNATKESLSNTLTAAFVMLFILQIGRQPV